MRRGEARYRNETGNVAEKSMYKRLGWRSGARKIERRAVRGGWVRVDERTAVSRNVGSGERLL